VKSKTRVVVDATSKTVFADLFKPLGFKRKGANLRRDIDGLVQSVNFQASSWGSAEAGSFTVNIGITDLELLALWTARSDTSPTQFCFPVGQRIGHLMPERCDYWWEVGPGIDAVATQAAVSMALRDHVVPLFQRLSSQRALNETMIAGFPDGPRPFVPLKVLKAMGQHRLGLRDEAVQSLREACDESSLESARTRFREIAIHFAAESEIPNPAKSP
jgi:hypothetical protein